MNKYNLLAYILIFSHGGLFGHHLRAIVPNELLAEPSKFFAYLACILPVATVYLLYEKEHEG